MRFKAWLNYSTFNKRNGYWVRVEGPVRYEGKLKNGQYDGEGKLTRKDGTTQDGEFKLGKLVYGKETMLSGSVMHGDFKNGKLHGLGMHIDRNDKKH